MYDPCRLWARTVGTNRAGHQLSLFTGQFSCPVLPFVLSFRLCLAVVLSCACEFRHGSIVVAQTSWHSDDAMASLTALLLARDQADQEAAALGLSRFPGRTRGREQQSRHVSNSEYCSCPCCLHCTHGHLQLFSQRTPHRSDFSHAQHRSNIATYSSHQATAARIS